MSRRGQVRPGQIIPIEGKVSPFDIPIVGDITLLSTRRRAMVTAQGGVQWTPEQERLICEIARQPTKVIEVIKVVPKPKPPRRSFWEWIQGIPREQT